MWAYSRDIKPAAASNGVLELSPFSHRHGADDGGATHRRHRLRLVLWSGLAAAAAWLAVFVVSFVVYANHVASIRPSPDVRADGIVVLTGGRARISEALELLEKKRAQRLLISGVHPATTARQIVRRTESRQALFACCVDLDRRAQDTIGNATESSKWAESHGFKSLIVVTSAYHMPRSILELRAAMPDMVFHPYPVIGADLNLDNWYRHAGTTRLLLREYVKYIVAWFRTAMAPAPTP